MIITEFRDGWKERFGRICGAVDVAAVRLWVVMLACSLASLCDVIEFATRQPDAALVIPGLICFAVCKASVITVLCILCRRKHSLRILAGIFVAGYIFLSLVNFICWSFYGFGITRKLITILSETNAGEVSEFIPNLRDQFLAALTRWQVPAGILILIALWILIPKIPTRIFLPSATAISLLGAAYFVQVCVTATFGKANHIIYARTARCVRATIKDMRTIRQLSRLRRPLPDSATARSSFYADRIVVVIGESASRDHLSLYGYPLPTSPRLDTISCSFT
ncbi:MAG: hypothetical protein K2J15_07470, partial [Muribaculaceae bacterium]|nr:hypothetical protein [Muribaculaceae bacterium]